MINTDFGVKIRMKKGWKRCERCTSDGKLNCWFQLISQGEVERQGDNLSGEMENEEEKYAKAARVVQLFYFLYEERNMRIPKKIKMYTLFYENIVAPTT